MIGIAPSGLSGLTCATGISAQYCVKTVLKQAKSERPAVVEAGSSKAYLEGIGELLSKLPHQQVDRITNVLFEAYLQGRTTYLLGNGGSAALASHLACDLSKGTVAGGRKRFRAVSLSDNVPLITAWANDFQFEDIFAEQLLNVVEAGDIVLAITTSGNSPNVVKALKVARDAGAFNIGVTGFEGGKVKDLCDLCLVVPSDNVQFLEDAHLCVAHSIFSAIRQQIIQISPKGRSHDF